MAENRFLYSGYQSVSTPYCTGNTIPLILILNLFPGELETGLGNLGLGKQTADEVRLQKMKEKAQVFILN